METVIQLTKSQLVEAQKKYYQEMIDNPEEFETELDGSHEQAERTIDHLLSLVES